MDKLSFIESLGPNKVSHPIETNEFEEGSITQHITQTKTAPKSPSPPPTTNFWTTLMLHKTPTISLLPKDRQHQELSKFKADLLNALQSVDFRKFKKLGLEKDQVSKSLSASTLDAHSLEYIATLWDVLILYKDQIYGVITSPTVISDVDPTPSIEDLRRKTINTYFATKKLKETTVKEIRELLQTQKISIKTKCEDTNKERLLLKDELHKIIQSYLL